MTMIGILAGQVFKSLIIDHYGLLGTPHRKVDRKRVVALIFIVVALILVAKSVGDSHDNFNDYSRRHWWCFAECTGRN